MTEVIFYGIAILGSELAHEPVNIITNTSTQVLSLCVYKVRHVELFIISPAILEIIWHRIGSTLAL